MILQGRAGILCADEFRDTLGVCRYESFGGDTEFSWEARTGSAMSNDFDWPNGIRIVVRLASEDEQLFSSGLPPVLKESFLYPGYLRGLL